MPDKGYVLDWLDAHDAKHLAILFITPEGNPGVYFILQLSPGHVGFVPPILGDNAFVHAGGLVDDLINSFKLVFSTKANQIPAPLGRMDQLLPAIVQLRTARLVQPVDKTLVHIRWIVLVIRKMTEYYRPKPVNDHGLEMHFIVPPGLPVPMQWKLNCHNPFMGRLRI